MTKSSYERNYSKGELLDGKFNEFINSQLQKVCTFSREKNAYPHDVEVRFNKKVRVKIIIETI